MVEEIGAIFGRNLYSILLMRLALLLFLAKERKNNMLSEVTNTQIYSDDKYGFTIAYSRKYLPTDNGGMREATHHVTLKIDDDIELTLPEFTALFKLVNEAYKQTDEYNKKKRELS